MNHSVEYMQLVVSGIHVYDRQILEWYHCTMSLHMDNLHKAWPKGARLVQWARYILYEVFLRGVTLDDERQDSRVLS